MRCEKLKLCYFQIRKSLSKKTPALSQGFFFFNRAPDDMRWFSHTHTHSSHPHPICGPAESRTRNTGFGGPDYIHLTTGPESTKNELVRINELRISSNLNNAPWLNALS